MADEVAKKIKPEEPEVELQEEDEPKEGFPRTVYKAGGKQVWGKGQKYTSRIVANVKELKAAKADGFIDDFAKALASKE